MSCDLYDVGDLAALLDGEPAYRVGQVRAWLARGVEDPAAMTDLPASLRGRLAAAVGPPPRALRVSSADAGLTRKVLLGYPDPGGSAAGEAVEAVLMLYPRTARRAGRATVCLSTQAGCAMGCPFCATGQAGFRRQLSVGEIVRQVTVLQRLLSADPTGSLLRVPHAQQEAADAGSGSAESASDGTAEVAGRLPEGMPQRVSNVVFMGMGEPLANLDATVAAIRWLHDDFGLSARGITVSTVGLVPGIRRLTALDLPLTLAVSLHAPDDALRDDLVPVNRQHPLDELLAACRDYRRATGRRLTFEYVLIEGVNAGLEQAHALAALLTREYQPGEAHVNLIPMNRTPAVPWRAPPAAQQHAFAAVLHGAGLAATVRHNRGGSIDAACGQLYADYAMASGRVLPAAVGAAARVAVHSQAVHPTRAPSTPGHVDA